MIPFEEDRNSEIHSYFSIPKKVLAHEIFSNMRYEVCIDLKAQLMTGIKYGVLIQRLYLSKDLKHLVNSNH